MSHTVILKHPTYELVAGVLRRQETVTLTLETLWPSVRKPEWHRTLTLTLPLGDLHHLGRFIVAEALSTK